MPYRAPSGSHYHSVEGCSGAMIPCPPAGLAPCSKCYGRGEGVALGLAGSDAWETDGASYAGIPQEDIPGAYARKYENSVAGYPDGMFKTADGIIRDRNGYRLLPNQVKSLLDDAEKRMRRQRQRVESMGKFDVGELGYLNQLVLEEQLLRAAYADSAVPGYTDKAYRAPYAIEPIKPDTESEEFYERRGKGGVIPKLIRLSTGTGMPIRISSNRLADIVEATAGGHLLATFRLPDMDSFPDTWKGKKDAALMTWNAMPPSERPQRGHLDGMIDMYPSTDREHAAYLGVDEDKAHLLCAAIREYVDGDYWGIRQSQREGRPTALANCVESYIRHAPKWEGGETYRGIAVDDEQVRHILELAEGNGEYDPNYGGSGSWSTNRFLSLGRSVDMSERQEQRDGIRRTPVVFRCPTQSRGTSVSHLSASEDEVLVSMTARYRVAGAEFDDEGILHVLLEEGI